MADGVISWEALDPDDPILPAVATLYETTQAPAERIDWAYLLRAVGARRHWRPGQRASHLLLTAEAAAPTQPTGFVYGSYLPDYAGYVCYLGVDPTARQRGLGTRLFEQLFRVFAVDAGYSGVPLPFVVWESHRPADNDGPAAWDLWHARLKLFARLGASWIAGADLLTPNYAETDGPTVDLQLFLRPWDEPAAAFTDARLRDAVAGIEQQVYRRPAGSLLAPSATPLELRSPLDARQIRGDVPSVAH